MEKINLKEAAQAIDGYWNPLVLDELNGQAIKLAKFKGAFDWHHHEDEDEAFLVVEGSMEIALRDQRIALQSGELIVIPRGVEHKPVADKEALVLLFEPASIVNTGNVITKKTRTQLKQYDR